MKDFINQTSITRNGGFIGGEASNKVMRILSQEEVKERDRLKLEKYHKENPMIEWEIWVGYYQVDYSKSSEPELLAKVKAIDFKTACLKYELETKLARINEGEVKGDLNMQDYPWWFNENTISNSWIGKYYSSLEEALLSFK